MTSETFLLNSWHNHPVYQGFYVFRNGDVWLDTGSQLGHLGRYDVRRFPRDRWITLQDAQGAPLPIDVYVQRGGDVLGRWVSAEAPAREIPPPSAVEPVAPAGFDIDALFGLAAKQDTSVPAELQPTVDDFVDFAGCILGVVLSDRQIDGLRKMAVQSLSQPGGAEAQLIQTQVAAFAAIKTADTGARHSWRQQNQGPFVAWMTQQAGGSAICQTLKQWYAEAQQVIAHGRPPLTREAAESWAELLMFAALIAQGREPGTAAPNNLEAVIAQLARDYPTLPAPQQLRIAFAPVALYELRRSWPRLSPHEREATRTQLARQFGIAVAPAAPAAHAPAASNAEPRWGRFHQDDTSVDGLQRKWFEAKAQGDEQRAAQLQLDLQLALGRKKECMAMLSTIASNGHGIAMDIIRNSKA
jgi:hypothetical protein